MPRGIGELKRSLFRSIAAAAVFGGMVGAMVTVDLATPAGASGFSWRNCGSASDPIQVTNLKLTPDPLRAGAQATLVDSWRTETDITSSDYQMLTVTREPHGASHFKEGPFQWLPGTGSLPIKAGNYGTSPSGISISVPKDVPNGSLDVHLVVYDASNPELGCLEVQLQITHRHEGV
jgi:hypothetical protein